MSAITNKKQLSHRDLKADGATRRIGRVVHDQRGNATLAWEDARSEHARPQLELLGPKPGTPGFDPYSSSGAPRRGPPRARTDLRKLSAWIKLMRELKARQRAADGTDQSQS